MNYQNILNALNSIKSGNIPITRQGICGNLEKVYTSMYKSSRDPEKFISESFTNIFGELILFPVEGDVIEFIENKHKWDKETDLGYRRYMLLDKMIQYAESKLNEDESYDDFISKIDNVN